MTKENWRILTNKEIYAGVKKCTIIETIRLNRLHWFGHVQRMEESRILKRVLYMNLGTTRLIGSPRNRWKNEVREDGRIVGGEGWQEKVRNREEWKKLVRMARNHCILHMPMEGMNS
jgi:transcription termination factor 2